MKQTRLFAISMTTMYALISGFCTVASTETKVTLNDYYRPFKLSEITPKNMQSWPYYRYTSMNWDEYGLFGTVHVMGAKKPAKLTVAASPFDIEQELREGWTFVESLISTQTKGFIVIKNNVILSEFYDNGFTHDQTQLLQSSSKTYAGIIASKLIDAGKIDPDKTVDSYLADFKGSAIGKTKVQQVLDMQAGLLPATDYHVPGGEAFVFEIEQGLKPGEPTGHRKAVINAKTQNAPGKIYTYNDKNTDLLAMLAEGVTGQPFNKLLSDLFNDFGATSAGSIALTADGTASPSYGISCTLRDYGLFHQWIAQGKAPKSFYASLQNLDKDLLSKSETGQALIAAIGTPVVYGSQGWYLPEHKIIYTAGSYGQYGFSDLETGISVVFMQDWEDNTVGTKLIEMVARALFVIDQLGANVKPILTLNDKKALCQNILQSIYDDVLKIENDYVALQGFEKDAHVYVSGTNKRTDFSSEEAFRKNWTSSLSFQKLAGPASKRHPKGELLGEDSCILKVRCQNIRNGQRGHRIGQSGASRQEGVKTYRNIDIEVMISILMESDQLRDRLYKIIMDQLEPLNSRNDKHH